MSFTKETPPNPSTSFNPGESFLGRTDLSALSSLGTRSRKLSEKGKVYQVEVLNRSLKTQLRTFKKTLEEIKSSLSTTTFTLEQYEECKSEVVNGTKCIIKVVDNLLGISGEELNAKVQIQVESVKFDSNQILSELCRKIQSLSGEVKVTATDIHGATSRYSHKSSSASSHRTSKASKASSKRSSVSSQRVKAEVEAAAASVQLEYVDREVKLQAEIALQEAEQKKQMALQEAEQKKLMALQEAEQKKLMLQKQLDIAKAKVTVFQRNEGSTSSSVSSVEDQLSADDKVKAFVKTLPVKQNVPIRNLLLQPNAIAGVSISSVVTQVNPSIATATTPTYSSQLAVSSTLAQVPMGLTSNPTAVSSFIGGPTTQSVVSTPVVSGPSYSQPTLSTTPNRVTFDAVPNVQSTPTVSFAESNCMVDVTRSMCDQLALSRLPVVEPGVFDGSKPLEFPTWKISFDTLIHSKGIPSSERLHYLNRYLSGEAKEAVQGFFMLPSEQAYSKSYDLLVKRYGDQFRLASAFRDKLNSWPKIEGSDSIALRRFVDFLRQCDTAMSSLKNLAILNDESENRNILQKLPAWLVRRWARKVADYRIATDSFPTFSEFVVFLAREEDIANDPIAYSTTPKEKPKFTSKVKDSKARSFAVEVNDNILCELCEGSHAAKSCQKFPDNLSRGDVIRKRSLCLRCLKSGHIARNCRSEVTCAVCTHKHHTAVHGVQIFPKSGNQQPQKVYTSSACSSSDGVLLNSQSATILPVYLSHSSNPSKELPIYCMLDSQSDQSFILSEVCESLGIEGINVKLSLSTMLEANSLIDSEKYSGFRIRGFNSNDIFKLPSVYSRDVMPANRAHIPTKDTVKSYPYLSRIKDSLHPLYSYPIGLLIGYNCPQVLCPREVIPPEGNGPYAQRTELGWSVVGFTSARDNRSSSVSFRTTTKEVINPVDCLKLLQSDFNESCYGTSKKVSQEDQQFLNIMSNNIHVDDSEHYEMPLPFKDNASRLFNNSAAVTAHMRSLIPKFKKDPVFKEEYLAFMKDTFDRGYAEEVPPSEVNCTRVWYIPHFGIYHKVKKKLRVVFDCSRRYCGVSLNDTLLQGPDLINPLIGVLSRFRSEPVAFVCDVEKMFYNFRVAPKHRDFLRFLWWPDGDITQPLRVYRMIVHIFGAVSSPSCSTFGFRHIASEFETTYGSDVKEFIEQDFYVDDGLKSVSSTDYASDLIHRTKIMCRQRCLNLHKFVSNNKDVLQRIPEVDRAKSLQKVDLQLEDLPIERVLGVEWCVQSDCFGFRIVLNDKPVTRRGILSVVSSIFDPLGFVAPFTLRGKLILQELCRYSYSWDEDVSELVCEEWFAWCSEVTALSNLSIARCLKPQDFGDVIKVELHHFSDASSKAYGQVSYIRIFNAAGHVHVSFLMGKSRVAPIESITIPRMELVAALLSIRISRMLSSELRYDQVEHFYWSDSQVVLGYIHNQSRRFHVYVANRVQEIRSFSSPEQWHFVEGIKNPADEASRGMRASNFSSSCRWLTGPEFLWEISPVATPFQSFDISEDDPELKRVKSFAATTVENFDITRFAYFSNWNRLVRSIALCLKFKAYLKSLISGRVTRAKSIQRPLVDNISVVELREAEREIIRLVQLDAYGQEMSLLTEVKARNSDLDRVSANCRNRVVKRVSSLYQLDCYLDAFGIIRVGGRLKHSDLPLHEIHPVVMPKGYHVTRLLIEYFHQKIHHQGRLMTHNAIRQAGYWVINGSAEVYRVVSSCVTCKRARGVLQTQKMADLPSDRVQQSSPFDYCGVDYFGPFLIKEGRKEIKRWGVIFTCLASRAVHLEVASNLSTSAFINVLRRFLAIRGPIAVLRCDQGTNFIGARNEFAKLIKSNQQVDRFLQDNNCLFEFKTNPPSASHMGGVWERLIRSVRSILQVMLMQNGTQLDDDSLRTFLFEVASILNSRPLTSSTLNDPSVVEPLTPNHLLTLKSQVLLPPPSEFVKDDLYSIKRWRRVQYMINVFWSRWRSEYLSSLQSRSKWTKISKNVSVGDIVLICDECLPRNLWKLGRVVETFKSKDDLVRKVRVFVGKSDAKADQFLERPVHKLVLLVDTV